MLQGGLVVAKSGRLELRDNSYGHYRSQSVFHHCDVIGQQSNRIRLKTQNKGYYAVQDHSKSSRSVSIEKARVRLPILVINSNWHPISYPVSELSQLIAQILDTLRFLASLWKGVRDNVRCSSWAHWKAHIGLPISDNWTFFARCYGWGATGENRLKICNFVATRSVWPKISSGRPPPIILYGQLGQWFECFTTLSLAVFT